MKLKSFLLCFTSAAILSLPYGRNNLGIFAWFGFLPLFFAIEKSTKRKSFWYSYLCGFLFFIFTLYWLVHVTLTGLVILCSYLAFYFAFFGYFFSGIRGRVERNNILTTIQISCLWVALEYIRGGLFTGFPWALLGYSQYLNTAVIQIADVVGGWGISFIVMFVNICIFDGIQSFAKRDNAAGARRVLAALVLFGFVFGYGLWAINFFGRIQEVPERERLRVSLVQGNIPQEEKWPLIYRDKIKNKFYGLTQEAVESGDADLVIWPETSFPDYITGRESIEPLVLLSKAIGRPLLFGAVYQEEEKYFNSAFLVSADRSFLYRYNKIHLVPFGEYVPFSKHLPFLADFIGIGDFTGGDDFVIFPVENKFNRVFSFGVLICFEDIFPELSRQFRLRGADFLVNITNDAWFKKTSSPYQHLQASVFRAVENRAYLARSANTGVSGVIDSVGRVVSKVEKGREDIFVEGFLSDFLGRGDFVSIYTRYGDVFVLLCCIYLLIFSLAALRRTYYLSKRRV